MSTIPLFCIADEAKELAIKATQPLELGELGSLPWFYLVTTLAGPSLEEGMDADVYEANEDWNNEWHGASEQACQKWSRNREAAGDNSIPGSVIAIADKRSSRDGTILIQVLVFDPPQYCQGAPQSFGVVGPSPGWYSFRMPYEKSVYTITNLEQGDEMLVYRIYFAAIADFTFEGILDTDKVMRFMSGEEIIDLDENGQVFYRETPAWPARTAAEEQ